MRHLSVVKKGKSSGNEDPRIVEMNNFYREIFQMPLGPAPAMKENPQGKEWTIIIPSWLTYFQALKVFTETVPFWKRNGIELPASIDAGFESRLAKNGTYAIALSASANGDLHTRHHSADKMAEKKILGITLLERMILELWYVWKTTDYLDKKGFATLCIGSRFTDGQVPIMRFHAREVNLYAFHSNHGTGRLMTREIELLSKAD